MKKRSKKFLFLLISIFFITSTIVLALSLKPSYAVEGADFYLFCTYSGSNEQEANIAQVRTKESGGVGDIFYYNEKVNVVACVYTSKSEAESVAKKNEGVVVTVTLPQIISDDKNYVMSISKIYKFVSKNANKLTNAFVELEKGNENEMSVTKVVESFETELQEESGEFFKQLSNEINSQAQVKEKCKLYCVKMILNCLQIVNEN